PHARLAAFGTVDGVGIGEFLQAVEDGVAGGAFEFVDRHGLWIAKSRIGSVVRRLDGCRPAAPATKGDGSSQPAAVQQGPLHRMIHACAGNLASTTTGTKTSARSNASGTT